MEEITEEQQPSSIFIKPSLTTLESTAKDGRESVGPNWKFETNWLSSSHPFVSVSLSMEEEEEEILVERQREWSGEVEKEALYISPEISV